MYARVSPIFYSFPEVKQGGHNNCSMTSEEHYTNFNFSTQFLDASQIEAEVLRIFGQLEFFYVPKQYLIVQKLKKLAANFF